MPIKLSPLKEAQLPQLNRGYNLVFKQYLPWPIRLEKHFYPSYVPANRRHTLVATDRGKVVAHAAGKAYGVKIGRAEITWSSYGNVMTLPEYRGRGLASRINARLWRRLRQDGVDGVYISGGRGLYLRAGAVPSGRYFDWTSSVPKLPLPAPGLSLKPCGPKDLDTLLRLQNTEAVGIVRTEKDFHCPLNYGIAFLNRVKTWLVLSGSTPLAFIVLGPSWKERKLRRPRTGYLYDYAGSRAAVLAGLKLACRKLGYRRCQVPGAGWDQELAWLLGGKPKFSHVGGTHLILDPQRMMRRLKPYFEERLGKERAKTLAFKRRGKGFELKLGKKKARIDGLVALTKLVFGTKAGVGGPFKEIFPLPFPVIGLNWT